MSGLSSLAYERGQRCFAARDYRGAIEELTPVVAAHPDNVGVRLLLARAHFHSAALGAAEQELREVLARDPSEYYAHLALARTLERRGRADEAGTHRRIAAALTGDDSLLEPHPPSSTAAPHDST